MLRNLQIRQKNNVYNSTTNCANHLELWNIVAPTWVPWLVFLLLETTPFLLQPLIIVSWQCEFRVHIIYIPLERLALQSLSKPLTFTDITIRHISGIRSYIKEVVLQVIIHASVSLQSAFCYWSAHHSSSIRCIHYLYLWNMVCYSGWRIGEFENVFKQMAIETLAWAENIIMKSNGKALAQRSDT